MAGLLPDVATSVAVMGVSFDITTITYMLPSGISGAITLPSLVTHLSYLQSLHLDVVIFSGTFMLVST